MSPVLILITSRYSFS